MHRAMSGAHGEHLLDELHKLKAGLERLDRALRQQADSLTALQRAIAARHRTPANDA